MLNELNVIARGLLGLHGYPDASPRHAPAWPVADASGRGAAHAAARKPAVSTAPQRLSLRAQGVR